jgi:hypothetical protein
MTEVHSPSEAVRGGRPMAARRAEWCEIVIYLGAGIGGICIPPLKPCNVQS